MKIHRTGKLIASILSVICIAQSVFVPCLAVDNVRDTVLSGISDTSETLVTADLPVFYDYISEFEPIYPDDSISVLDNPVELSEGQSFKTSFQANQAGLYTIKLSYSIVNSYGQYPVISLRINENIPYAEAQSINLMRKWETMSDDDNPLTDETLIPQREIYDIQSCYLKDTAKYYGDVLYFYLNEGLNTIELLMDSEKITVHNIVFENPEVVDGYKTVRNGYGFEKYIGEPIYIEGENADFQSDASLYPYNDPSSATVSPSNPYVKYLNVIGGTNWSNIGQYLEWKIIVPEDGLYKLGFKYRQNTNYALDSIRTITIDGKQPFAECKEVTFPYTANYKNITVTADGEEAWFALTKGEHTIRMEVTIGELGEVLTEVEDIISKMNDCYRKVIMITGTNPDSLRDYFLDDVIPDTLEQLESLRVKLEQESKKLKSMYGGATSGTKVMETTAEQLLEFSKDSAKITAQFADFKSNISSLGTWLVDAKKQPLSIDYICLYGEKKEMRSAKANFWESFKFQLQSFLYTFTNAYKDNLSSKEDSIVVWTSAGSTQHRILKQLVDSKFNNEKNINVDIKLVTSSLLSAIIAGKEPDVALGIGGGDIMNFAFRKAGVSLSQFDDFDELKSYFRPSSFTAVTFDGNVYGMPETQLYQVMFYRTDILNEMNIKIPKTWDDVISAMAALKKKNLEFGIPLETGMYTTLLFQRGKSFYNEELTATAITDYASLDAFQTCCSWFTEYKCPLSYNGLQRFRTGEMPILIAGFNMYNELDILAPEIKGLWGMEMIPGTLLEDGSLNQSVAVTGTYSVILKEDNKDASWEFIKWWTSSDIQLKYGQRVEMALGQSGRYNTANIEAFSQIGYPDKVLKIINAQGEQGVDVPPVPGSYFLTRYLTNAMNKALYQGEDPADALIGFAKIINEEITYKREEFGLTN